MAITMKPTEYQQAIFDAVINLENKSVEENTLIIAATAGSGKTTTLLEVTQLINPSSKSLIIAFNKHIVKEIEGKLTSKGINKGNIAVKTVHSLGYGCLAKGKKLNCNEDKYKNYVIGHFECEKKKPFDVINSISSLIHFIQVGLNSDLSFPDLIQEVKQLDPDTIIDLLTEMTVIEEIIDFYNVEIDYKIGLTQIQQIIKESLKRGVKDYQQKGLINYDDMLFLPFVLNLSPLKYDVVLGDECQDWSRSMLSLILKAQSKRGYSIFVGDPYQSINGFAGSNPYSFDEIKQVTNHVIKPLSTCFRCAKNIIKYAQTVNPQIEHHENAIDGKVEQINLNKLFEVISGNDLVLCRLTAPLVSLCIQLIGKRIKAQVIGRNIGTNLTTFIKKVDEFAKKQSKKTGEIYDWESFPKFLSDFIDQETTKIKKQKNAESKIESLNDKYESVIACYEGFDCYSVGSLILEINNLFSDDEKGIMLSTVHRAKGLESDRVFIISPEKLPLKWKGMQDWEVEQERNIQFVAYTRAKKEMYFVLKH